MGCVGFGIFDPTVSKASKLKWRDCIKASSEKSNSPVDVLPAHGGHEGDGIGQGLSPGRRGLKQLLVEIETVPAHNHVLHGSFADIGDLMLFLAGVRNLPVLLIKHGLSEMMGAFEFIELVVNVLAQLLGVHEAQQEFGAHGPASTAWLAAT